MSRLFCLVLLVFSFPGFSQIELEYMNYPVDQDGMSLDFPFAGGINSAQFNEMDLDLDGDLDLVIFDRSSETISCFENVGEGYESVPYFESIFPSGILHWMVLADFNGDGRNDLFTYSNLGVRVFENVVSRDSIDWNLVADPLTTEGNSGEVNIFFNATDIPSIVDLDGDGDLDILHYNFSDGDHIIFQKNYSMERTNQAGLDFVLEDDMYGLIDTCECNDFSFSGETCHAAAKLLHIGGKALLSYDHDGDQRLDLVVGQEDCPDLSYFENRGDETNADFNSFDTQFPTFMDALDFPTFPAAYYLDVTQDGEKDLLVSQNVRSDDAGSVNFKESSFIYENQANNFFNSSEAFLQDEMIDVGSDASPFFVDIDGDGWQDLVISGKKGELYFYRQTQVSFEFITADLFGFSAANFSNVRIQFVDLNNDGKEDLAFKASEGSEDPSLYVAYNESENSSIQINPSNVLPVDITVDSQDDFFFEDINDDGEKDLLIGTWFGELDLYENTGENLAFILAERDILETDQNNIANLSISIQDLNRDGEKDLITTRRSGAVEVFLGFPENRDQGIVDLLKVEDNALPTRLGRYSLPAVGQVAGRQVLAVGTVQGGIRLFEVSGPEDSESLTLKVYPNPSETNRFFFETNDSNGTLSIYDMLGHPMIQFEYDDTRLIQVDLSHLNKGVYLAKFNSGNQSVVQRLMIN